MREDKAPREAARLSYAAPCTDDSIDAQTITFEQLLELVTEKRRYKPKSAKARDFSSRARAFCKELGLTPQDPARKLFDENFEQHLSKATEQITGRPNAPHGAAKNIRWAAGELHGTYQSLVSAPRLLLDFAGALQVAISNKGWTAADLIRALEKRYKRRHHNIIYKYLV